MNYSGSLIQIYILVFLSLENNLMSFFHSGIFYHLYPDDCKMTVSLFHCNKKHISHIGGKTVKGVVMCLTTKILKIRVIAMADCSGFSSLRCFGTQVSVLVIFLTILWQIKTLLTQI